MYRALYREWRPKLFDDVVGQEHITTTLKNQVLNNRIAHAYLFCGTRGTGKTSVAKVFAKALNCLNIQDGEPCNKCEMCLKINKSILIDVIELDAASNNGVDKIRDIIEDVKYPPQEARYKVYIMDEVHMLSIGAVNAFLKTLEEPPTNVVFILATTDPQKLPITILSRCQRFDFKRINSVEIADRLKKILEFQEISIDEKSLGLISRVADGSMRDSLSILDQAIAMSDGFIKYENVMNILGLVDNHYLFELTEAMVEKNIKKCIKIVDDIVFSGKDVHIFIKDLIYHCRNILMSKVANNTNEVLDMSEENIELVKKQSEKVRVEEAMRFIRILQEAENTIKLSKQPRLYLELSLIKICKIEYDTSNDVVINRINKLEEKLKSGNIVLHNEKSLKTDNKNISKEKEVIIKEKKYEKIQKEKEIEISYDLDEKEDIIDDKLNVDDIKRRWTEVLDKLNSKGARIASASLRTGKIIDYKKGNVFIDFDNFYDSFEERVKVKDRLMKDKNKKFIEETFSEIFNNNIKVNYIVDEKQTEYNNDIKNKLKQGFGEEIEFVD